MIIFPGFTQVAQLRNRGDWGVLVGDKHSLTCPKTATSMPGDSPKLPRAGGTITENEGHLKVPDWPSPWLGVPFTAPLIAAPGVV